MQKSIIELQSIATFLITDFFSFVLVAAIAKLILIKGHRETTFFQKRLCLRVGSAADLNFFRPREILKRR